MSQILFDQKLPKGAIVKWNDKKLSWMDPKLKNKLIPNYFFYRVGTKWWKSLRKFSTWKLHPCCYWWLKNTKHPKRGIYSFCDFWFWRNPHKTKFVLKSRFLKDWELYWSKLISLKIQIWERKVLFKKARVRIPAGEGQIFCLFSLPFSFCP